MILPLIFLATFAAKAATIAIIDTGFDLDHIFLRPRIINNDIDEKPLVFQGLNFHDNSHLKKPVIENQDSFQEVLRFRDLRAKGHRQGLSLEEFDWYKRKSADKEFMTKVRAFKKHAHGTFVAGIALREGENISIFPIRGLQSPVVAVEDSTPTEIKPVYGKSPELRFHEEIRQSVLRVTQKFAKICRYVGRKKFEVVNGSYGITYKSIMSKFRENYKETTGNDISEEKLREIVNNYFQELYTRSAKTIEKYPNILFVFSAGNSSLNNDEYHHYPSRINLPNTISVAAMNGDYLASFSNYGETKVDIGAPGVGVMSLVPKAYGDELFSPASGTSMAAPWISNLAAQIINTNPKLRPSDIKKIILETGDKLTHLKPRLVSGAKVNNRTALKAALLSIEMTTDEAIHLANSNLLPMEDKISIGTSPMASPEELKKKLMDSVPTAIAPSETDEIDPTSEESSSHSNQQTRPQDNSVRPLSKEEDLTAKPADPVPSNQNLELSQKPSEDLPASSSRSELRPLETQSRVPLPSSP